MNYDNSKEPQFQQIPSLDWDALFFLDGKSSDWNIERILQY